MNHCTHKKRNAEKKNCVCDINGAYSVQTIAGQ